MEKELSRILSLDLLTYKLPTSENLVLYKWTSEERVNRSQIFLGANWSRAHYISDELINSDYQQINS